MKLELVALKLILDDLGISSDIKTVEDRKLIQKAIYLLQETGGNLNYKYRWYKMGPYSTDLTADYYRLNEAINLGAEDYTNHSLSHFFKEKTEKIKKLFNIPNNLGMSKEDWLELLSSVHFLFKKGNDWEEINKKIQKEKTHLFHGIKAAKKVLSDEGLVR